VHHINFLVRDLAVAIPAWERVLDMPVTARDSLAGRGVDIARFRVGETWVSLVQPTRPGTVPARHLETHGEGFFLMSLEVDSLDAEVDRLGEASFSGPARDGLEDWWVRDLDIRQTFGAQLQLVSERGGLVGR
jgi:catechol 2,3-dioxygenase-like lactoylglutathione lyase family enzyme